MKTQHSTSNSQRSASKGGRSAIDSMDAKFNQASAPAVETPKVSSFREFLEKAARVVTKIGIVPYTFAGRKPLSVAADLIDDLLGSHTGVPLTDGSLAICGGAQFGKTIIALWLMAYLTAIKFLRVGYYLPDDELVQGIVDTKLRPEVIDVAPWFAEMTQIGKMLNDSGKAVNRKGAFMVTDGVRTGIGYMRGMGKIPTSFSMDVIIEDEKDDIPDRIAKFLPGRMSSSDFRLRFSIGTQRIFGAGQQKEFEEGSQFVGIATCPECKHDHQPEEDWPGIVRLAMDGVAKRSDPQMTFTGDFRQAGSDLAMAEFDHDGHYYYGCVQCGCKLDADAIDYVPRRPDRIKERKLSIRISQMCTTAIALKQMVFDWCTSAVRDPEAMRSFRCDRMAIPKSTLQKLEPAIMERARTVDAFDLSLTPRTGAKIFAGLDTGDRCWFTARDVLGRTDKRLSWAEQLSTERCRERIPILCHTLGVACLFIDIGAERELARDLCYILNGLLDFDFPKLPDPEKATIYFPNGLIWRGDLQQWSGLRCAAVEFSLKDGQGIRHKLGITQDGKMYPVIQCNRDESIQRVINELLTAAEDVVDVVDGKLRTVPSLRLPQKVPGSPLVVELLEKHFMAGSRKEIGDRGVSHFVDGIENHFLLSATYGALAETVGGSAVSTEHHMQAVSRGFRPTRSSRRGATV